MSVKDSVHKSSHQSSRRPSNISNALQSVISDNDNKDSFKYTFSDSDEDIEFPPNFDEKKAYQSLLSLPDSINIFLVPEKQREMGLEVGVNITEEFPWKQISRQTIINYLAAQLPKDSPLVKLQTEVTTEQDEKVLVGYIAEQSKEEEDMFIFFETNDVAREASAIIKNLEISRRKIAKAVVNKKTRAWQSLGSEAEVDLYVPRKRKENIEVEIQSHFPIHDPDPEFRQRLATEVRDGYVELVASKKRYESVTRLLIDVAVQVAPKTVNLELQTDPTFPTNAWSQYFYEIKPEIETAEVDAAQLADPNFVVKPPPPSSNINELLKALEFNEIDMYRNDYPDINKQNICKFKASSLSEPFCFLDLRRTQNRVISCIEWHPQLSGVAAVAYNFETFCTTTPIKDNRDVVKREIIEPNPVLLWTFENTIHPKIEFESPREITVLSFCPYDGDLLVGGTKNGQLQFWDLKNKMLPSKDTMVLPLAAASSLELSPKSAITAIEWLNRSHSLVGTGQLKENLMGNSRFFVTSAMDGTIIFWDLDLVLEERRNVETGPASLAQDVSEYSKFHGLFRPFFMLEYNLPILSIIFNKGEFSYKPKTEKATDLTAIVAHEVIPVDQELMPTSIKVSTLLGCISTLHWEGLDAIQGTEFNKEQIKNSETYGAVHGGPVICMDRNPFHKNFFMSICCNIFAIWDDDSYQSPVLWRKRNGQLTCCKWSLNRPSVFFLTKADGSLEIWDLLSRTDDACLNESICGSILTTISQHRLSCPQEILGIGDHNSTFRIFVIPLIYTRHDPNEISRLLNLLEHQIKRRNSLRDWQTDWNSKHGSSAQELLDAADQELLETLDSSDAQLDVRKSLKSSDKKSDKSKFKGVNRLTDQLEEKWQQLLYRHRMNILRQTLKAFEPPAEYVQIVEEEKIRREEEKQATRNILKKTSAKVSEIRKRLLKVDEKGEGRIERLDKIVNSMMLDLEDGFSQIETGALKYVETHGGSRQITLFEIIEKGIHRREVINKSLGVNMDHIAKYDRRMDKAMSHRASDVKIEAVNPPKDGSSGNIHEN